MQLVKPRTGDLILRSSLLCAEKGKLTVLYSQPGCAKSRHSEGVPKTISRGSTCISVPTAPEFGSPWILINESLEALSWHCMIRAFNKICLGFLTVFIY